MVNIKELAKTLAGLTKEEAIELTKEMKEVHGFSAPEPTIVEKEIIAEPTKTSYKVELTVIGPKKLELVKLWKNLSTLSLMEAKKLIEEAPVILKSDISKEEADSIKSQFAELGGEITIS